MGDMTDFNRPRAVAFDLRGPHRPGVMRGALAVVCGLPVLVRNLLVLERAGCRQALLLVDPSDTPAVKNVLGRHPRLRIGITWVEDAGGSLEPAAAAMATAATDLLYWPSETSCGRVAPAIATAEVPAGAAVVEDTGDDRLGAALILFGAGALADHDRLTATQLADELLREGRAVRLAPSPQLFAIASKEDVSEAETGLLRSLRKEEDGALARYDRAVSLAVSRRLLRYPVTPNHATVVAGLVGLASGVIASRGGYTWLLAGALCFLGSNIIDGIDGELARAKLLESRLGQWLDTVFDDATNLSYWVGTAIGCYRTWHAGTSLVLGAMTALAVFIVAAVSYHYLVTVAHSGDLNAVRWPWERGERVAGSGFLGRVKFLLRRDTVAWAAVVAAGLGQSWLMLWLAAVGSTGIWVAWAGYTVLMPLFERRR
jgi:phosphatidylglycerophosphate synthase